MSNQVERKLVIDAIVELSLDGGKTWQPCAVAAELRAPDRGPWAIPHAIEIGRSVWANWSQVGDKPTPKPDVRHSFRAKLMAGRLVSVRVVDTSGVLVEQWPKKAA
jgi:hypothetical protein